MSQPLTTPLAQCLVHSIYWSFFKEPTSPAGLRAPASGDSISLSTSPLLTQGSSDGLKGISNVGGHSEAVIRRLFG